MIPGSFGDSTPGYDAVRRRAGVTIRADRGRIVVSGRDRAAYLQGLLTNDIVALAPGSGCYAAYLTPQGRMISDLWVYELGDVMLLCLSSDAKDTVLAKLDQFIFSEDVQLGDVTERFSGVLVVGPQAAAIAAAVLVDAPAASLESLHAHGNLRTLFKGNAVIVVRVTDFGVPAWELLVEAAHAAELVAGLSAAGAESVDARSLETLRIEAGVPRFHVDMDEETIPLEAGIESQAISLTKGCYVGQEVIVRVLHRGHGRVARKLVGLVFDGDQPPAPGAAVHDQGRQVGQVTSSTMSPVLGRPIALAYVQRETAAPATRVAVDGMTASVTKTPFVVTAS